MKYAYIIILLALILAGCATAKMVCVSPEKTAREIKQDEAECNTTVDSSDLKDASLKQNKFNQCMQAKGYKLVSEEESKRVKGFKEAWVNPDINFKVYETIFVEKVDVSGAKVKNMQLPGTKVTDQDIDNLGAEMLKRFSKILDTLIPVASTTEEAAAKKTLCVSLKLKDIAQTNIGFNTALQVVSRVSRIPLPGGSQGVFSFEGTISDFSTKEKLITISDESRSDKNASLAGIENFERWQHAYNTMDYWADCLASLLAAKRGQKYVSQIKLKLVKENRDSDHFLR